jgi:hypothetical protein
VQVFENKQRDSVPRISDGHDPIAMVCTNERATAHVQRISSLFICFSLCRASCGRHVVRALFHIGRPLVFRFEVSFFSDVLASLFFASTFVKVTSQHEIKLNRFVFVILISMRISSDVYPSVNALQRAIIINAGAAESWVY